MDEPKTLKSEEIQANIAKLMAETMKLSAEGARRQKETRWLPVIWATAFAAAVLTLAKFMH